MIGLVERMKVRRWLRGVCHMHSDGLRRSIRVCFWVIGVNGFLSYGWEAVTRAWRRAAGPVICVVVDGDARAVKQARRVSGRHLVKFVGCLF